MTEPSQQQPGDGEGAQGAPEGGQQARQPEQSVALPVEQVTSPPEPAVTGGEAQTEQPDQYTVRDVSAQESMVFWAMMMFIAAVATFIVTTFGTLLIRHQVKLTREAVEDTGKATVAMENANEISRAHSHADLRPYVYLSDRALKITHLIDGLIGDTGEVVFTVKNYGRTPAKNVIFWAAARVGGYWSDTPPDPASEPVEIRLGDIPPNATVDRDGYHVSELSKDRLLILQATSSVFAWGRITYEGAAGERFETNFRLAATGDEFWEGRFTFCPEGNGAT